MHILTRFAAAISLVAAISAPAFGHGFSVGALEIGHPAIFTPPPSARAAGGYLTVTNTGTEPDRLLGAESAAAKTLQIHISESGPDGVATMRHLPEGVEIPAGAKVVLESGGMHIMLMGLTAPLSEGEKVPATLIFEKAGRVDVEFAVDPRPATAGGEDHSGH